MTARQTYTNRYKQPAARGGTLAAAIVSLQFALLVAVFGPAVSLLTLLLLSSTRELLELFAAAAALLLLLSVLAAVVAVLAAATVESGGLSLMALPPGEDRPVAPPVPVPAPEAVAPGGSPSPSAEDETCGGRCSVGQPIS